MREEFSSRAKDLVALWPTRFITAITSVVLFANELKLFDNAPIK